jgi:hypothetical protein
MTVEWPSVLYFIAGTVIIVLSLRAVARREMRVYEWLGFRLKRDRVLRGRVAILAGLWGTVVGLALATAPWWTAKR